MRGGSIPLLAWGTVLLTAYAINWIWEGRLIQFATTLTAVLIVYAGGVLLWLVRRESIRRGPPPPDTEVEPVPQASTGAVFTGLSAAAIVFGFAWSKFLVFGGVVTLVFSLGRVLVELYSEHENNERVRRELERR
jgi:hypothetical protein